MRNNIHIWIPQAKIPMQWADNRYETTHTALQALVYDHRLLYVSNADLRTTGDMHSDAPWLHEALVVLVAGRLWFACRQLQRSCKNRAKRDMHVVLNHLNGTRTWTFEIYSVCKGRKHKSSSWGIGEVDLISGYYAYWLMHRSKHVWDYSNYMGCGCTLISAVFPRCDIT